MARSEPSIASVNSKENNDKNSINLSTNTLNDKYCEDVNNDFQIQDKQNHNNNDDDDKGSSSSTSSHSLSISIVTMNNNAEDSSIVDSDSETELDVENSDGKVVLHKLGEQSSYAPNSSELQDINKGLKIICEHITPKGSYRLNNDLTTTAGTSNIGNIALTNSNNVQFGDKHFYEGPVTIQQFLIGNQKKRKKEHSAAYDNPEFKSEETSKNSDAKPKVNLPENNLNSFWSCIGKRVKHFAILTTGIIIAVMTITSIFLYTKINKEFAVEGKQLVNEDKDKNFITTPNGTFRLITRDEWTARSFKGKMELLKLPIRRVIIQHTVSPPCQSDYACIFSVQIIQNLHMDTNNWDDIGYNFLIGSEGQIIVGRGWQNVGAHTIRHNRDSIGIAFIGSFNIASPSSEQIKSLKLLLEWGVMENKLTPDYRLYGARQLIATESPGIQLFSILKNFTHFSEEI